MKNCSYCLLLAMLFFHASGCSSSKKQTTTKNKASTPKASESAKRATPPADWIKSTLKSTGISIHFPTETKSRVTSPDFLDEALEDQITIVESRTNGELRCQVAEYRMKPSLTQPDQGFRKFTMSALNDVVRFQHDVPNYDLEQDSDKLLKRFEKTRIIDLPAYSFELQVRDGTFEGYTIQKGEYIVFAWAGTNAKTSKEAVQSRRLFAQCIGVE